MPPPAVAQPRGLTALGPSVAKGHRGVGQGCPIWMPMDTGLTVSPEQEGEGMLPEGSHTAHPRTAREWPCCLALGCQTHAEQEGAVLSGPGNAPTPLAPKATRW